jgi:glycine/D-amino acid oxidase-like deaminating enzyme
MQSMILPGIEFETEMRWSGIMGLGKMKKPIVKQVGQNLFCACRTGGMGIAIGTQTGEDAADLIYRTL